MAQSRKKLSFAVVFAVLTSLVGCGHFGNTMGPRNDTVSSEHLELTVANAADSAMVLPSVTVSLITTDGTVEELGETDRFGMIELSKDQLDHAILITACARWFFCGAIFIEANNLTDFNEYFLTIAPVAVRSH